MSTNPLDLAEGSTSLAASQTNGASGANIHTASNISETSETFPSPQNDLQKYRQNFHQQSEYAPGVYSGYAPRSAALLPSPTEAVYAGPQRSSPATEPAASIAPYPVPYGHARLQRPQGPHDSNSVYQPHPQYNYSSSTPHSNFSYHRPAEALPPAPVGYMPLENGAVHCEQALPQPPLPAAEVAAEGQTPYVVSSMQSHPPVYAPPGGYNHGGAVSAGNTTSANPATMSSHYGGYRSSVQPVHAAYPPPVYYPSGPLNYRPSNLNLVMRQPPQPPPPPPPASAPFNQFVIHQQSQSRPVMQPSGHMFGQAPYVSAPMQPPQHHMDAGSYAVSTRPSAYHVPSVVEPSSTPGPPYNGGLAGSAPPHYAVGSQITAPQGIVSTLPLTSSLPYVQPGYSLDMSQRHNPQLNAIGDSQRCYAEPQYYSDGARYELVPSVGSMHSTGGPVSKSHGSVPMHLSELPPLRISYWEDQKTQVVTQDIGIVQVSRRLDNNMVNGTKMLNLVGMSRGKRDAILKMEHARRVVRSGAVHLKGVWVLYERARQLAATYRLESQLNQLLSYEHTEVKPAAVDMSKNGKTAALEEKSIEDTTDTTDVSTKDSDDMVPRTPGASTKRMKAADCGVSEAAPLSSNGSATLEKSIEQLSSSKTLHEKAGSSISLQSSPATTSSSAAAE